MSKQIILTQVNLLSSVLSVSQPSSKCPMKQQDFFPCLSALELIYKGFFCNTIYSYSHMFSSLGLAW